MQPELIVNGKCFNSPISAKYRNSRRITIWKSIRWLIIMFVKQIAFNLTGHIKWCCIIQSPIAQRRVHQSPSLLLAKLLTCIHIHTRRHRVTAHISHSPAKRNALCISIMRQSQCLNDDEHDDDDVTATRMSHSSQACAPVHSDCE